MFGSRVTEEFNHINGLDLICLSHQLVYEGYKYWFLNKNLITIWSAPNYWNRCGNLASIMIIDKYLNTNLKTFSEVPQSAKSIHPRIIFPYFL